MAMKETTTTFTATSESHSYELILGKIPSLNKFYSGRHWAIRKKEGDIIKHHLLAQLGLLKKVVLADYEIHLTHNYRYDNDNCIMAIKFGADAFRYWGGCKDDTSKYFTKLTISRDKELPVNTGVLKIIGKKM
jgi:hypothetical protein